MLYLCFKFIAVLFISVNKGHKIFDAKKTKRKTFFTICTSGFVVVTSVTTELAHETGWYVGTVLFSESCRERALEAEIPVLAGRNVG